MSKLHSKVDDFFQLMKYFPCHTNAFFRETIPAEEQQEIFGEIHPKLQELEMKNRKMKRSRTFVKPKKTG